MYTSYGWWNPRPWGWNVGWNWGTGWYGGIGWNWGWMMVSTAIGTVVYQRVFAKGHERMGNLRQWLMERACQLRSLHRL